MPRLIRALVLVLAIGAVLAPGRAAAAGATTLQVPLYTGYLGIQTGAQGTPRVRVLDSAGAVRADVTPTTARPKDGHWVIELGPPGDLTRAVLLQPGDRIEVTVDGATTAVTVPTMTATADVAADTVSGQVPPTLGVYVSLHRDPQWFGAAPDPAGIVTPVGLDGRFTLDLAGKFDLRPGTWGEVSMADTDGHIFAVPFAPPSVTVHGGEYFALIRANPNTREVVLAFEDGRGGQLFRSVPAVAIGSGLFAVILAIQGRPEYGVYRPQPGDELALYLDGTAVVRETVPWLTATVDGASKAVSGLAPAGAHLAVTLATDTDPKATAEQASAETTSGADGRYRVAFPALGALAEKPLASVVGYPGGAAAYTATGTVPRQTVALYGNQISGTLAGWGHIQLEHTPQGGGPVSRIEVQADPTGYIEAQLFAHGEPATFAPGDHLVATAEKGDGFDVVIPSVTTAVDAGAKAVHGQAPPGAPVTVDTFAADPDYFGNQQYQQPYTRLMTQAGPDGQYTVRCATPDCGVRYGTTTARLGSLDFRLEWLDTPLIGVGVTLGEALAKATAGLAVSVTPLDASGQPGTTRTGLVRPSLGGGLPEWTTDLSDVFPVPMLPGNHVRIAVGDRIADAVVPPLTWTVGVANDDVSGTGPALHVFLAVAIARQDNRPQPAGATSGAIDPTGHFHAHFDGFDVQPGDDAELYLFRDNHYLWWDQKGVRDPEVDATATPEVTPTAVATEGPRYPAPLLLPYASR
jgi:hypothetical protein